MGMTGPIALTAKIKPSTKWSEIRSNACALPCIAVANTSKRAPTPPMNAAPPSPSRLDPPPNLEKIMLTITPSRARGTNTANTPPHRCRPSGLEPASSPLPWAPTTDAHSRSLRGSSGCRIRRNRLK